MQSSSAASRRFICCALALLGASAQAEPDSARVSALFVANCAQCHLRPGIGVPMAGAPAEWADRITKGEDALLKNVVEGIRGMPPLGYCGACTEEELRALTRLVAGIGP